MEFACCGGPDEKIPPASGTNKFAGFVQFRPLLSWKKDWVMDAWGQFGEHERRVRVSQGDSREQL